MDIDRPHFRTTSTGSTSATASELFICFTSRLSSSSSMKLTKSILSPGRAGARDGGGGPVSLSSSLSHRLRANGSLKGGASPFLTTTGKKRGGGFENPEPSSPKVTCIGQVRVKTKKKVKQSRSLSKRRSGEVSFRKIESGGDGGEDNKVCSTQQQNRYSNASAHFQQQPPQESCLPHRNQRWVHLPISICEALREFSCLFPCKSSCFSTCEKEKAENNKQNGTGNENGCGAVFARWLVSVNDGEGGKRGEIELVVGGGDEEERAAERISMRSSRRHVFEDIEVKDDRIEVKGQSLDGEEEKARVSICIPPKNALLLMRCRSDPMKMASLANRFSWDAQGVRKNDNENIEEENNEVFVEQVEVGLCEGKNEVSEQDVAVLAEPNEEQEIIIPDEADQTNLEMEKTDQSEEVLVISNEEMVEEKEQEELQQEIMGNEEELVEEEEEKEEEEGKEEVESNMSSFEDLLDQENTEHYEDSPIQEDEEAKQDSPVCHLSPSTESDVECNEIPPVLEEASMEKENEAPEESNCSNSDEERDTTFVNNDEENQMTAQPETTKQEDEKNGEEIENPENQEFEEPKKEKETPILPECLLLMMCEPKLSMEVSKETWVCSTDFIRWLPERPRKAAAKAAKPGSCNHETVKRRLSIDSKPKYIAHAPAAQNNNAQQPPRSSCSLPAATAAAASMATMIEQKLVNAVGYEPFVLTRCKSEPMRTAAAKLMPESCFWKNAVRKLEEPHRRATLGVGGAAGVGF